MLFPMKLMAQVPYVVWCEENTTLYFTYRSSEELTYGGTFTPEDGSGTKTDISFWSGASVTNNTSTHPAWDSCDLFVTRVVFEPSFSEVRPVNTSYWFHNCSNLTTIIGSSNLNTASVTNMSFMFCGCNVLTSLDVSSWDTGNVTDMSYMFQGCNVLTSLDVGSWDTRSVTNMQCMFSDCWSLTSLDLGSWDTENVTGWGANAMFTGSSALATIYAGDKWNINTPSSIMFDNCTSLVGGNGTTYNSSNINETYAHIDAVGNPGYLTDKAQGYHFREDNDNSSILVNFNDKTINVTIDRTIYQDGGWNTICLPFALTSSEITTTFGSGTKVMELTGDSYDASSKTLTLNFTDVAATGMEAGMPYLIKTGTEGDPLTSLSFTGKTITKTAGSFTGTNVTLHGLLSPAQVVTEGSDVSHILFIGEGGDFYNPAAYDSGVENSGMMKGMRAYFTVDESLSYARARGAGLSNEDMTGIEMVMDGQREDNHYYTLQGVRVEHPTQGIYIKNGKKIFIQ